jgi:hypothetical protein
MAMSVVVFMIVHGSADDGADMEFYEIDPNRC